MATAHQLRITPALQVVEWPALGGRRLSNAGRTDRIASLTLTARRMCRWVGLPDDERQTVDGCLRRIDFLDEEIAAVNRAVAEVAVGSREMRRQMSVPGVTAAA